MSDDRERFGPELHAEGEARLLRPVRRASAAVLACVFGVDEHEAQGAAAGSLVWDERRGLVRGTTSDGAAFSWRFDAVRSGAGEAWEALAARELIPMEWACDEARTFTIAEPWRGPTGANFEPRTLSHPPTLRSCVSLASDTHGVATAEALLREASHRARVFGATALERLRWLLVVDPELDHSFPMQSPRWLAELARVAALVPNLAAPPTLNWVANSARGRASLARWCATASAAYVEAAARGATSVRGDFELARHADPFEPLVRIWRLGYGFDTLGEGFGQLIASEL